MLRQTLELLGDDAPAADSLRRALAGTPLSKPVGHKGGDVTDMLELRMNAAEVEAVVDVVCQAAAGREETSGTRGRGLGGFVEAWQEYRQFIAAREQ